MHTFQRIRRAGICLASAMVILCSTLMPASAAQEASKATEPTEATASAADTKTAAFDPMDEAYQVAHTNRKHTSVISAGLFASGEEEVYQCLRSLSDVLQNTRGEKDDSPHSLMTRSVLEYIRLHAAEPLRLSEVAERFHINTNYLSLLIKRETGTTFHDHVLQAKMEIAHTMLADPRVRVSEVAHAIGYSNYISFYNTFKRLEHMTPTEYRNKVALVEMDEDDEDLTDGLE